jgi:hypothetical protein
VLRRIEEGERQNTPMSGFVLNINVEASNEFICIYALTSEKFVKSLRPVHHSLLFM